MKKKTEKSSSGLIKQRLGEKYKKREQVSPLSNSEFFSSLSSYIIYSFFFLTESECKPKILFTQPSLIDEQTIQWTLKMALAVSIAVVKEFIFMEKISSTVLSLTF